jgi:hypothetical protein
MNCSEFQSQLDRCLEERRSPDHSVLSEHAAACADCQSLWDDWLLLERAIGEWNDSREPVDVDLTDRVIAAARREGLVSSNSVSVAGARAIQSKAGTPHRRGVWPLVVTVALVLLAVLIVFRDGPDQVVDVPQDPPTGVVVIPDHVPIPNVPVPEVQPDLEHLIADARSAWESLRHRAAEQARDLRVFVPDIRADMGLDSENETAPEETPEGSDNPVPLPDGVNRAFDFLFEADEPDESQTT